MWDLQKDADQNSSLEQNPPVKEECGNALLVSRGDHDDGGLEQTSERVAKSDHRWGLDGVCVAVRPFVYHRTSRTRQVSTTRCRAGCVHDEALGSSSRARLLTPVARLK